MKMKNLMFLAMASLCLASATSYATLSPNGKSASGGYGDDFHRSTLYSLTEDGNQAETMYSCPWVDIGLEKQDFNSAKGWKFTYAGEENSAFIKNDLKVEVYEPWVVTAPRVETPRGTIPAAGPAEWGGAYLQLSYTPKPGDPCNIRWIQAVDSSYHGGAYDIHLDNPYDRSTPFYDPAGAAGVEPNKTGWFYDRPSWPEDENEINPVADFEAQVFLAEDFGVRNGVQHDMTIYGGLWWGYQYSAFDNPIPEPTTVLLFGLGGLALLQRHKV